MTKPTSAPTRTVVGVPSYNGEAHIGDALRSLLGQIGDEVTVVVVDDASTDGTASVAAELAADSGCLHVEVNPTRLGMVANWNHALQVALRLAPEAEFFAWGSDHDLWSPRWLEAMVAALDARAPAVLAYPLSERLYPDRADRAGWRFDTVGASAPRGRLSSTVRQGVAGDMIYGLFRAEHLRALGGYARVVYPDRLLLARAALRGEFVQVDDVLWHRRMGTVSDPARQRTTLFGGRAPWHSQLPWWLEHPVVMPGEDGAAARWTYLRAGVAVARRQPRAALARLVRSAGLRAPSTFQR